MIYRQSDILELPDGRNRRSRGYRSIPTVKRFWKGEASGEPRVSEVQQRGLQLNNHR